MSSLLAYVLSSRSLGNTSMAHYKPIVWQEARARVSRMNLHKFGLSDELRNPEKRLG